MRLSRVVAVLLVVGALAAASYLLFTGPRMKVQPHLRTYDAVLPALPPGTVPVDPLPTIPGPDEAARLVNPLPPTPGNIVRGRAYYGYYCLSCHGEKGDGNGPVGQSYVPSVPDLRSEKTRLRSDGQLYLDVLTGAGHAPVLAYAVPPEHRWYLVLFLRTLAPQPQPPTGTTK